MDIWWIAIAWVVGGIVSAGYSFAYFQGKWPTLATRDYKRDLFLSIGGGILYGPINLLTVVVFGHTKYGWRLW